MKHLREVIHDSLSHSLRFSGLMRFFLALLFAVSTFAAEPVVTRDVFYTDAKDKLQSLDVHAPAQGEKHPVIVWIHGGGWKAGDKGSLQKKPKALVEKGFVLVSLNYRFMPAVTVKDMMGDLAKGMRWVREHVAEHRGDPERIVVMGHSAGAHLAALLCTDDRYLKAAGVPMNCLKGCVPLDVSAYDIPKRIQDVDDGISSTFKTVFGKDEASRSASCRLCFTSPRTSTSRPSSSCMSLLAKTRRLKHTGSQANLLKQASRRAWWPRKAKRTAPSAPTSAARTIHRRSSFGSSSTRSPHAHKAASPAAFVIFGSAERHLHR